MFQIFPVCVKLYLRLAAHDAQTGTGSIHDDFICDSGKFFVKYCAVVFPSLHDSHAEPLRGSFDQTEFVVVNIAGNDASFVAHPLRRRQRFASRRRAEVQYSVSFFRRQRLNHLHRTHILNGEKTLFLRLVSQHAASP